MNNKIKMPLPNGDSICAEINPDTEYKEIFVYLETKEGGLQDLAIVGADYTYPEDASGPKVTNDKFHVYVYGSEYDECYTESFEIGKYKEDE